MTLYAILGVPFLASLLVCWLMILHGPKDGPDGARKTQIAPVPSAGGVGIMAGLAAAVGALALAGVPVVDVLTTRPIAGVVAFTVCAALIGWVDDVYGMKAMTKLLALLGAAAAATLVGPQPAQLWIGGEIAIPALLGAVAAMAFIFVMANAVNFMDGANGIAMGTCLVILAMMGMILAPNAIFSSGQGGQAMLMALMFAGAAAIAGFLVWNLRGQLYAGDCGSLSIGGLVGAGVMLFAMNGPVLMALTLCLPILIDVFLTLVWRAKQGRPLMRAHRDHAYQLLLRAGWGHGQVARLWWGMAALCAGAVTAGPFAAAAGAYGPAPPPLDVVVFFAMLTAGSALWVRQRMTLGRQLEAAGS